MNEKRKATTERILKNIAKIIPGDKTNVEILQTQLNGLTDQQFEDYIRSLGPAKTPDEIGRRNFLPFYLPNLSKNKISIARNYKLARDLGRSIDHRLIMTDAATGLKYVTPHPYPVVDLPVRRQAQTEYKKRSIPEHNQKIDDLTDQPTNDSKGSRVSAPELAALNSRGLKQTIMEFINVRGGNSAAYREMKRLLIEKGECRMDEVMGLGKAKSTQTLAAYLNCMHLGNNLDPDTPVPEDAKAR